VATAESLAVHPNTVSYRLRRIEDLLGLDFHDAQALLQFQLAFLIESVLGAPPGAASNPSAPAGDSADALP